ncbi:MAG: OOP family OmpA-OmpF porin [Candidatus Azotimanducaceae bacterium]|jgi:OOP family OmpA-OmpF porin
MKNFLVAFLVFLVWSVFGLWIYSFASSPHIGSRGNTESISEIKIETATLEKDTITSSSEILNRETIVPKKDFVVAALDQTTLFEAHETIAIEKDTSQIILPDTLADLPAALTAYLQENPGQELHITSCYSASEKIKTPNIGVQRANDFEKTIVALGADKNQLVIKPILTTEVFDAENKLSNGMTFSFKLLDRERIINSVPKIPNTIIFYPAYDFDEVLHTKKLKELIKHVVTVLEDNPSLKVTVVGHTDHIGANSENYIRGLKSARQIRWYLVTKGAITSANIIAISKGETDPILREGMRASRAENERIEIQFSKKP